jgi:hypothetical protein
MSGSALFRFGMQTREAPQSKTQFNLLRELLKGLKAASGIGPVNKIGQFIQRGYHRVSRSITAAYLLVHSVGPVT